MIPKLSGACYAIRLMVHISNINILELIYYACFHFILKYRIISGGTSSNSGNIFHYTKENSQNYGWCTTQNYFNRDSTHSMSINTLINFNINKQENFPTNSSIHNINTRNKHHLHRQNANLSCCQKSTFYAGIKIFNSLPSSLTIFKNDTAKFKVALRKYLNIYFCYSVD